MNVVDAVVTKVLSKPYFNYMWCVDVEADFWGSKGNTIVYCNSKEDADKVDVGYKFLQ